MNFKHIFFFLLFLPAICLGNSGRKTQSDTTKPNFISAQSGLYYEISMSDKSPEGTMENFMKIFVDPFDNVRIESQTSYPGAGKINQTQISMKNDSTHTMLIDNKNKEYTINTVYRGPSPLKGKNVPPVITRLGNETINGFPCTILNIAAPMDSCKLWISDAVPGYKRLDNALQLTMALGADNGDWEILNKKGYKGIWVKYVATDSENKGLTLDLVKAEHKNIPESMMKVPSGYKKLSSYDYAMKHQ